MALQRVAAIIILLLGFAMGWFANTLLGGVSAVVRGVARPQAATPAVDHPEPIRVGNSVIISP